MTPKYKQQNQPSLCLISSWGQSIGVFLSLLRWAVLMLLGLRCYQEPRKWLEFCSPDGTTDFHACSMERISTGDDSIIKLDLSTPWLKHCLHGTLTISLRAHDCICSDNNINLSILFLAMSRPCATSMPRQGLPVTWISRACVCRFKPQCIETILNQIHSVARLCLGKLILYHTVGLMKPCHFKYINTVESRWYDHG